MPVPLRVRHEYNLELTDLNDAGPVDAVVLAVAHDQFKALNIPRLTQFCCNHDSCGVIIDVKGLLERSEVEKAGLRYWSL